MITLAEFMIIAGADNRPPMLEKSLYDSWKIPMEFYMENRENGRMILDSVQNGPLVWPTITEEDGTNKKKTYAELSASEKLQADCDCKATNIVLQGLPLDVYAIVNHHKGETLYQYYWRFAQLINNMNVINMSMRPVQVNINFLNSLLPEWSKFVADVKLATDLHTTHYDQLSCFLVFNQGDDPIACLNIAMAFLIAVASSSYKGNATSSRGNNAGGQTKPKRPRNAAWFKKKAMLAKVQEAGKFLDEEQLAFLADPGILDGQTTQTTIPNTAAFQTEDLDVYDSGCDDVSNAKVVLMANLSNYGSDVISEVPHSDSYNNDMDNQSVHAMQVFEQTPVADFSNKEIHSDSNIIPYSQYLQETQQAIVQDTNLYAQQDLMILSVIEQMSEQMINHVNN
ncbi:hypothetical protein Tco_0920822 [Tanacetum coccineum]